ncbi:MAG: hypothetical protein JJ964_01610 [Rhizobiales bacterium]|nr:hypothetical protein [Hyphomicrobiales bacterium]
MTWILLGFISLAVGIYYFSKKTPEEISTEEGDKKKRSKISPQIIGAALIIFSLFSLASTSFVNIDANRVGHLKRIYAFEELPEGRIIALEGQKGPQARILGPGFHFSPFIRVLYDVEQYPTLKIPEGSYGEITSLDGAPMPDGMFIAPAIPDDKVSAMLDAKTYLQNGGYRGPQETVLKPGSYRINRYLFDVEISPNTKATIIPAGHVGVVKSNVKKPGTNCVSEKVSASTLANGALSVPLVTIGCVGIWKEPLFPGAYYLNHKAYEVTLVDTRVQTWEYKGGYTKRHIDLSVDQQGNIQQNKRSTNEVTPKSAADRAVFVKVEGWDIPVELRALVQVSPENAPVVVGSVGGLGQIENRILTPAIRSIVRNVAGSNVRVPQKNKDGTETFVVRPTKVLDFIENREAIETTIESLIKVEGRKAGVEIREIRIGEPAIPPELLLSRLRVQLADQLSLAYARETSAQQKRIETEQARATANEQPRLVQSQIAVKVANQRELERAALGRAEREFLEELARGQSAQANVLGKDRVTSLQALDKVLSTLENKPELVSLISRLVPHTVVSSENGGGLAGAAAILSSFMNKKEESVNLPPKQ